MSASTFLTDDEADDPTRWAGYRAHTHARSTRGGLVVLVDGHEQGLATEGDGDGRWFLICHRHSTLLSSTDQRNARSHMSAPEGWCEACAVDVACERPS